VRKGAAVKDFSPDKALLMTTLVLVGIGVVMVYSASMPVAQEWYGSGYYYLKRQLVRLGLGVLMMLIGMKLNYGLWRKLSYAMLGVCFGLLVLVLVSPLARVSNGAQRWLAWGGFSFQPTEIAKWGLIVYLAHSLAKLKDGRDKDGSARTLPIFVVLGAMCLLVAWQPDLGNCLIMVALALVLFFIAGVKLRYLAALGLIFLSGFLFLVSRFAYSQRRILNFLNPWRDPTGAGFQLTQSFLALGRGGLGGVGLGASRQKVFYLPEAHTDFILAVIGEEWGFIGLALLLLLFAVLIWQGLAVARRTPDSFGSFLAAGITSMIGLQALVNMGVVAGLLPTKGLPLPFVSYGGSALVLNMLGMGVLLSISRYKPSPASKPARGFTCRR
jgi:cell division protein FtsW